MYRVCPEGTNPQDWWDNRGVFYRRSDAVCKAQQLADKEGVVFEVRWHEAENPTLIHELRPRTSV